MKCKNSKPKTFWEKIIPVKEKHNWNKKEISDKYTLYRYRTCDCGLTEVYSFKYNTWRDINEPWKWDWEKQQFMRLLNKNGI